MAADVTTYANVLKRYYNAEKVAKAINDSCRLTTFVEKQKKTVWKGSQIDFPVQVNRNWGGGWSTTDVLPQADEISYELAVIPERRLRGRIQISGSLMKIGKGDLGAFVEATAAEIKGMRATMRRFMNFALWGDGTGKLCETASVSSQVVTLRTTGGTGLNGNARARYLAPGMRVAILDGATGSGSVVAENFQISSVAPTTPSFTAPAGTDVSGVTSADSVYISLNTGTSSRNGTIMGVAGIVDDTTYATTHHNINRSNFPVWQGGVLGNSGANRLITTELMQQAVDMLDRRAGKDKFDGYWCEHGVRAEYAKILQANKYFVQMSDQGQGIKESLAEGNYSTDVTHNKTPFIAERDCPWNTIFCLTHSSLKLAPISDWEWADEDGDVFSRVSNTDAFEAFTRWIGNFYSPDPNQNVVIRDVTQTIPTVAYY